MLRVVADTNVLVSSLLTRGRARAFLEEVLRGNLKLVISPQILDETRQVLRREKFRKYLKEKQVEKLIWFLVQVADMVRVRTDLKVIKDDPDDNVILNTALDGKANYIVSGDKHLLVLRNFRGITVLNVGELLKKLAPTQVSEEGIVRRRPKMPTSSLWIIKEMRARP